MRRSLLGFALAAAMTAGLLVTGCPTNANNVAACRELEDARCKRAMDCGIDLGYPLHAGSSPEDAVVACELFYEDACLHGLTTTYGPAAFQVTACVAAVTKGNCNVVTNPESDSACAWLIPPDAGVDAGVDASTDVVVASQDTGVVVTTTPDATTTEAGDASSCDAGCEDQCDDDPVCLMQCCGG